MVAKTLANNPFHAITGDSSTYFLFSDRQPQARILPMIGYRQDNKILVRRFALSVIEYTGVFAALQQSFMARKVLRQSHKQTNVQVFNGSSALTNQGRILTRLAVNTTPSCDLNGTLFLLTTFAFKKVLRS